jgi:ubiquinone/menaquinone biosynthesis C-methylase UbiE
MSIFIGNQDKKDVMTAEGVHDIVYDLIRESHKVLDVGCGTGVFSVNAFGHEMHACGLEDCKFSNVIPFKQVDFNKDDLPYLDNSFDGAVAIEIIEHVNDPHKFITELHRVVKKGGTVVITTPNVSNWYMRIYYMLTGKLLGFDSYVVHKGDPENNHISPIIWQIYKPFIEKYFTIEEETTNRSFIPLLRIKLPFKNMFFADTRIVKLRKR